MRMPGTRWMRQRFRAARARRRPHVAILGYHRVSESTWDPFDLAITPSRLGAHLAFLAAHARPISLEQAARELSAGRVEPRTVVVTFDDGYQDTLTEALPLLRTHRIPATVFACTGNAGDPFWWDEVAVSIGSDRRRLAELTDRLRPLPAADREREMRAFRTPGTAADLPRALLPDELTILGADPLIEIGGHTVSHPVLTALSPGERAREIGENRAALVSLTKQRVRSFSYPNGALDDATKAAVRDAGYDVACSSDPDAALPDSNPLALPRLWADGKRALRFESWITRWLA
ncbi:MAG TPA: polysaccharide deacetylase family protein [Gemmatimonadaceae bacterium]